MQEPFIWVCRCLQHSSLQEVHEFVLAHGTAAPDGALAETDLLMDADLSDEEGSLLNPVKGKKGKKGSKGKKGKKGGEKRRAFSGPLRVQSVLLSKEEFTRSGARKWVKDHKFRIGSPEETRNFWRFRQIAPEDIKRGTFRTKEVRPGVKFVFGVER